MITWLLLKVILLSYEYEKVICSRYQIQRYARKSSVSWPWYLTKNDLSDVTENQTFILQTIYTEIHVTEYVYVAEIYHTKYIILLKSRPEAMKSKLETEVKALVFRSSLSSSLLPSIPKASQRL